MLYECMALEYKCEKVQFLSQLWTLERVLLKALLERLDLQGIGLSLHNKEHDYSLNQCFPTTVSRHREKSSGVP